jgi:hypothetical protein
MSPRNAGLCVNETRQPLRQAPDRENTIKTANRQQVLVMGLKDSHASFREISHVPQPKSP